MEGALRDREKPIWEVTPVPCQMYNHHGQFHLHTPSGTQLGSVPCGGGPSIMAYDPPVGEASLVWLVWNIGTMPVSWTSKHFSWVMSLLSLEEVSTLFHLPFLAFAGQRCCWPAIKKLQKMIKQVANCCNTSKQTMRN